MKTCTACGIEKTIENFYFRKTENRYESRCKPCHKALSYDAVKKRHATHREIGERLRASGAQKPCIMCERELPYIEFNSELKSADGHSKKCRDCSQRYAKQYYADNKEAYLEMSNASRKRSVKSKQEFFIEYLRSHPCVDCGIDNILVLQADHLKDKRMNVCAIVNSGRSLEYLQEELARCEIRCANCHQIKTAKDFNFWRLAHV